MAPKFQLSPSKAKAAHITGEQFRYGLRQVNLAPDRFAQQFCNGRISRVHDWLNDEPPLPPRVQVLWPAPMMTPEARSRAIAMAEQLTTAASSGA